jgi:hypothetical protein
MGSSFGICGPAHVIEAECLTGLIWYDATSPNGVAVRIARRLEYASGTREPETEIVYAGHRGEKTGRRFTYLVDARWVSMMSAPGLGCVITRRRATATE